MKASLTHIAQNWKSGLTVALVSIPLSVSLAVASQTSPIYGIITAIWAGLIAAIFAGSHYNIIGPTGALSGILATYAIQNGFMSLSTLALTSGLLILAAYFLKLERYLIFIPSSTIQGFTLGVAFIIGLNQLNFALGISGLEKHERFISNITETFTHLHLTSFVALSTCLISLLLLFILTRLLPKFPSSITVALLGIILGYLSLHQLIPVQLPTLGQQFPDLNAQLFAIPTFQYTPNLLFVSFAIALVAILETMISAKIADNMTNTKYKPRKEMLALGLANIASGIAGGIPATAALARTSLNIKSGATHQTSALISSLAVAIISLIFLQYFSYIPLSIIAAILIFVAIRMVEMHHLMHFWIHDKTNFSVTLLVAFITIYEDPIIGIILGALISLLLYVDQLSRGHFDLVLNDLNTGTTQIYDDSSPTHDNHLTVYSIKGELMYFNAQAHLQRLEQQLLHSQTLIIRLRELHTIDLDGIQILDEIIKSAQAQHKNIALTSLPSALSTKIQKLSQFYDQLHTHHLIFTKTTHALQHFGYTPKD